MLKLVIQEDTALFAAENAMRAEAQAIIHAQQNLNRSRFLEIAQALSDLTTSKCVVTGVGKSAIAARKIAATLATCTIPALFVDPVGLYHGELGALQPYDLVLMISHSGQTDELLRLLPVLHAKHCVLVSIVGHGNSTLGRLSMSLHTRVESEPFARVPTASFAATVAIGDALAIAAATLKQVTDEELALEHPGGTIGRDSRA